VQSEEHVLQIISTDAGTTQILQFIALSSQIQM
jgi:hypothetical protein